MISNSLLLDTVRNDIFNPVQYGNYRKIKISELYFNY